MPKLAPLFLGSCVAVFVMVAGCGASRRETAATTDAGAFDEAGFAINNPPGSAPVCTGPHCSSDLHSWVDCGGNKLNTCPDDQACILGGGCKPACEAARENKSSTGCDFYAVEPQLIVPGGCFAAFVANTWSTPATLKIDYNGQPADPNTVAFIASGAGQGITYVPVQNAQIPAGQVAVIFLSSSPSLVPGTACPSSIKAVTTADGAVHGTAVGPAFHISTDVPVVAYDIFPYGGGSTAVTSATLLLPTSSWDTNYVAVDAWAAPGQQGEMPSVAIVAAEDDTTVTIKPSAPITAANGVEGASAGAPHTYTVPKGQTLQFTQPNSLIGSIISSTKPVGVWAGKTGLSIEGCCGESAHQQIAPVRALGSEYAGVRYRNRYDGVEETPPWRIMGTIDGTKLTWEPDVPPGAPSSLNRGQMVVFDAAGPFLVRSQDAEHPFYMSAHMTGAQRYDTSGKDGRGDAEFVNMVPAAEYLESYVFFTDPTYPETNLVVVRRRGQDGFADVELDCAGNLQGWQPIGASGNYEYTRTDLVRHNFQGQGNCNNGRHEMHSRYPFGLTVWGWGSAETGEQGSGFYTQYVSYAYPAGGGMAPINTVVIDPLK